jgi:uncharacterized protein (TIRG00374 family)
MRTHLRTFIVLALAVVLVAVFLRNADFGVVWSEIRHGQPVLLLLALVAVMATYALRAFRWQYMLRPLGTTHFGVAFRTTVIGFASSFLLPARAGEFIRPYLLARREGLSATAAFATIFLERLFDLMTVVLYLAIFLLAAGPGPEAASPRVFAAVRAGGLTAALGALAVFVVCFLLAGHPAALGRLARKVEIVLPRAIAHRVASLVQLFAEGLAVIRQPRRLLITFLLSLPLWASITLGIWLVTRAYHIEASLGGGVLLTAILVVGVAVPTPGAVGGFHEAYRIGATSFFGAPNDRAVGAAIILHAISFLPVAVLGIVFMAQEGISLGRVRQMSGRVEAVERVQ